MWKRPNKGHFFTSLLFDQSELLTFIVDYKAKYPARVEFRLTRRNRWLIERVLEWFVLHSIEETTGVLPARERAAKIKKRCRSGPTRDTFLHRFFSIRVGHLTLIAGLRDPLFGRDGIQVVQKKLLGLITVKNTQIVCTGC